VAGQRDDGVTVKDVVEQPDATKDPAPPKGPYDDLLCTICGLTACWKAPATADKTPTS